MTTTLTTNVIGTEWWHAGEHYINMAIKDDDHDGDENQIPEINTYPLSRFI
jgi:hypothetical protein